MKQLVTVIICWLTCCTTYAQHDPVYSLYLNNPFAINPAYAGLNQALQAQVSYRLQWTGMEGNPRTLNFNAHSSILNNKGGLGVQAIQDRIGENTNTEVQAAFSYKVELTQSTLSFGIQAGGTNFASDATMLTIRDPGDPNFFSHSNFIFNTGAGLLLRSDRYFIGLSAPRLLPAKVTKGGAEVEVYTQSLYISGAYLLFLSENVNFKPAVLFRGMENNPISTDLQSNFTFRNSYSAGVFTRNFNTYGLLVTFRSDKFQFGYAFEIPTNGSVGSKFLSHEVTLSIRTSAFRFHDLLRIENF